MKRLRFTERFPLLDIILTCTTVLLILGSSYLLFAHPNNSTSATSNQDIANSVSTTIDEIESNFSGIKIVTEISNDLTAPFAIQYPQSKHVQFNDEVTKYIQTIKHDYLTDITAYKENKKGFQGELNISFETFEHNGIYSFVLVKNEYVGNKKGEINIQTFRLNAETGEPITIETAFDNQLQHLQDISQLIDEQLHQDKTLNNHLLPEQVAIHIAPDWDNFRNFALTEDAIVFYFEQNTIAQSEAGAPIVSIPYEMINASLAKSLQIANINEIPGKQSVANMPNEQHNVTENEDTQADTENIDTSNKKRVALTFDDGPDPKVTTRILDTLEKYNAKATFYMLGSRVEYYPEIAKTVYEAGHEIGNHSWTHPNLTKANSDKIINEIDRTSKIIEDVTGHKPETFRPPYGAFNDNVLNLTDLPMILWDVDTLDWKHRSANQLLAYVKGNTRDGSIILMHDIHPSTADGLDAVLAYLVENDYHFVTISELNN